MESLYDIFSFLELPNIDILDVGASTVDGDPPYHNLKKTGRSRIYGFEPSPEEYKKLKKLQNDNEVYLPYALGDGKKSTLNICQAPGMTSLLTPDYEILDHFHGWSQWAEVLETQELQTHRLDDIQEISQVDYVKLDVQGGELDIILNGKNILSNSLVIQTEVNFIPFYEKQPLFAELDLELRKLGFILHTFAPIKKRAFKPLMVNNNIYEGINQVMWTDAIYVRSFTDFNLLSSEQLIKIALILHDLYYSFDLVMLALKHIDNKEESNLVALYSEYLLSKK